MQADEPTDRPTAFDPAAVAALLGDSTVAVAVLDTGLRFRYVNPALERLNGIPASAHLGRTAAEVLPEFGLRPDALRAVLADGGAHEVTFSGRTWAVSMPDLRHWHAAYHRIEENGQVRGIVMLLVEVTEAQRRKEELDRARSCLALLDTAAVSIGTTLDVDTTCQELADLVVPALADIAAVEVFPPKTRHTARQVPAGVLRLRRAGLAATPGLRDCADQFGGPGTYIDYQEGAAVPRALAANRPVIENLDDDDDRPGHGAPTPERAAAYRAIGLHSAVVVPLTEGGRPLGILSLLRAGDSPPFSEGEDLAVARELASRAATGLDHARRYAREHGVARELQRSLLCEPWGPHPHIEIATRYLSADQGALVGGDWFDVIPLRDGRHLKVMGDVMGHGVEAAVTMSHYRSLLRLLAGDDQPPHRILEQLDAAVERSGLDRAATCLLAVVDRRRGVCQVASAGHPPPVLIDAGSARVARVRTGPPLGTGFGGYRTTEVPCRPETVLLMYTDGLVERRGEDIDASVERLTRLTLPASGRLEDLLDEVLDRFGDGAQDDIAVLASRARGR